MNNQTLKDILQSSPSGEYFGVPEVVYITTQSWMSEKEVIAINTPPLELHCDSDKCRGTRLFEYNLFPMHYEYCEIESGSTSYDHVYIEYLCQNCKENLKSFAIMPIKIHDDKKTADIIKMAEYPFYGPNIPSRLISLIGPDRELFLKGLKCESQGLGIAAFSYYRRVIENQRDRIIDSISSTLAKTSTDMDAVTTLTGLKKQRQFSTSIDELKPYLPDGLLIEGHNPLSLLHKSLSIGIHELSDEECLACAHSIRVVLSELAKKLKALLSDNKDLKNAISLLNKLK